LQSPITIAFGLPIPSTDPLFLTIVGVHVLFGLVAVTSGALAMMSRKGRGRHANSGTIYFWSISGVFATMSVLSLMRWAENWHLLIVGAIAFASAWFGRAAARRRLGRWPQVHLLGMAGSYIGLLTGFYVDNGKNLPLWRELPNLAFWLLPSAVGVPLALYVLWRHPVIRAFRRSDGAPPAT
jgi:hypothetical protein